MALALNNLQKVDMPLNKETNEIGYLPVSCPVGAVEYANCTSAEG